MKKEIFEKIIIKNYNEEIPLDEIFKALSFWQILTDQPNYREVLYTLQNEGFPEFNIMVKRTFLPSGTFKVELYLEKIVSDEEFENFEHTDPTSLN